MNRQEILLQLKSTIEKNVDKEVDISSITESTNFINDLNLDSVHLINLLVEIEEFFSISIEEEKLDSIFLIKDLVDIISEAVEEK